MGTVTQEENEGSRRRLDNHLSAMEEAQLKLKEYTSYNFYDPSNFRFFERYQTAVNT